MKTNLMSFALAVLCAAPLSAQSLGEIAAKSKAEHDSKQSDGKTKPAAKTYSNDDLKGVKPIAPVTEEIPVVSTPQVDAAERKDLRDEIYWRRRLNPLLSLRAAYPEALRRGRTGLRRRPLPREAKCRVLAARA